LCPKRRSTVRMQIIEILRRQADPAGMHPEHRRSVSVINDARQSSHA